MPVYSNNTCKAWCDINADSTPALSDDFNISGITDHDTGDFSVTFDNNFTSANYSVTMMSENFETTNGDSYTVLSGVGGQKYTSGIRFRCARLRFDTGNIPQFKDTTHNHLAFFGDGGYS